MTGAYSAHNDNYRAMKEDRDRHNGQKKIIDSFNRNLEQKLAEAEDEELSIILAAFSSAPPATCKNIGLKPMIIKKQQEGSD